MAQTARSKVRVEMARGRMAEHDRGMVKGLEFLALEVLMRTKPPDAPAYGEGLVDEGCIISYLDGKRVGGDADKKPKSLRAGKGALVAVGFPFPARFQEMGTVNQPPRPFLTPVVMEVVGDAATVIDALARGFAAFTGKAIRKALRGGVGST